MKRFFNKAAATLAGGVVFVVGCGLAALGLMVMAGLSVFALAAMGLALLASPFVALMARDAAQTEAAPQQSQTAAA